MSIDKTCAYNHELQIDRDILCVWLNALKESKQNLLTNCFSYDKLLSEEISRVYSFRYVERGFLNIHIQENGYLKTYFWIADIDKFFIDTYRQPVKCDFFFRKKTESIVLLEEKLNKMCFLRFSVFDKWILRHPNVDVCNFKRDNNPLISFEKDESMCGMILNAFDRYSHELPIEGRFGDYMKTRKCIVVNERNGMAGFLVYSTKDNSIVEDFWYVNENRRRRGIASVIYEQLFAMNSGKDVSYIAWVNENNVPSQRLREKYGSKKTNERHVVYLRR